MAYVAMANIIMALSSYGLYAYGTYGHGQPSSARSTAYIAVAMYSYGPI